MSYYFQKEISEFPNGIHIVLVRLCSLCGCSKNSSLLLLKTDCLVTLEDAKVAAVFNKYFKDLCFYRF